MLPSNIPSKWFIELSNPHTGDQLIAWCMSQPPVLFPTKGTGYKLVLYNMQGNVFATFINLN